MKRRIAKDILPALGRRAITEIKPQEITAVAKAIEGREAGDLAKRALQTMSQIFRWAIAHGHAEQNPAGAFRPSDILKATPKRNYARIDARQLPRCS